VHSEKHDEHRISTWHGITIDSSVDDKNARDSIRFNDDGDSNKIDESDVHSEKHDEPSFSTWHGITIDLSFDDENVSDSICLNDDGDSNEIDESDWHLWKVDGPRMSNDDEGIQTLIIGKSR
jgi:hypothetical protein